MITYILKVILFSGLLLTIYHLLLEREKMHRFNRFYLLLSIILPFAVPLVPIETGSPFLSAFESINPAANKLQVTELTGRFLPVVLKDKSSTGNNNYSISIDEINNTSRQSIAATNPQYDATAGNSPRITGPDNHNKTLSHNEGITIHGNLNNESNISRITGGSFWNINQKLLSSLLLLNITVATDIEEAAEPQSANFDIISSEANIEKDLGNKSVIDPEDRKQIQAPPPPFSDDFIPVPPTSADLKSFQSPDYLVFIDGYMQSRGILDYYQEIDFAHYHVTDFKTQNNVSFVYFLTREYYRKHRGLKPEELLSSGSGVSQKLMDEYEKIINKYTAASMSGGEQTRYIRENITSGDRSMLEEIYLQMTIKQRKNQRVIFWPYRDVSRSIPTPDQFESFKDPKLYGVWIDGSRADNKVLENYSHTDFARMSISKLMKNAKNYGNHAYQLNLMTNSYFEEFRDKMSVRKGNMLMYRIRVNQDEASELQPPGEVQSGTISWEVSKRTDASGNEFNEITGVFEGTMWSKEVDEVPLKVKIFVTNHKGGEMFTEFYEAGSESPAKLYPESPNYTKIIVYSRLPSGEIIEMEQTSGGSHMWDFYIRDVTTASGSQDSRYGEPREGDFLNFILEQDEILNLRVQLHPAEHKIYRFNLDPTGLKELFAEL